MICIVVLALVNYIHTYVYCLIFIDLLNSSTFIRLAKNRLNSNIYIVWNNNDVLYLTIRAVGSLLQRLAKQAKTVRKVKFLKHTLIHILKQDLLQN